MEKSNYAFTIQIPAFKKVYHFKYAKYATFDDDNQMQILDKLISNAIYNYESIMYDITYERHKDGRWHAHGSIYRVDGGLETWEIKQIQEHVCKNVGVKTQKQFNEVFCFVPIYAYAGWQTYIEKDLVPEEMIHNDVLEREEYFEKYRFK